MSDRIVLALSRDFIILDTAARRRQLLALLQVRSCAGIGMAIAMSVTTGLRLQSTRHDMAKR